MSVKSIPDNSNMTSLDIQTVLESLVKLEISDQTTGDEASAAMKIFGSFNQCMVGMVSFLGSTPWERHQDDELLQIIEGEVDVTVLSEEETRKITLRPGSVFIVPRGLWHNQSSHQGVKLIFITSKEGNEESSAEDLRITPFSI